MFWSRRSPGARLAIAPVSHPARSCCTRGSPWPVPWAAVRATWVPACPANPQRQAEWRESGQPWDACLESWVHAEGLHAGQDILDELDARFDRQAVAWGPYFFADLAGTTDADEQAAIDSGLIQANRSQYAGRRKSPPPAPSA